MRFQNRWLVDGLVLLGAFTVACGAAPTPQRVASYPRSPSWGNVPSAVSDGLLVVETVYLTLEVNDPTEAAETAARWAVGYGGYENNRYTWQADGGRAVSQEIFISVDQSENLFQRLVQTGWKKQASIVRHPENPYSSGYGWAEFSIQYLPYGPAADWRNPLMEQIREAICRFAVGAAAFLMQAAASLLVAIALVIPCVLMVVGAVTLIRWLFRR